MRTRGCDRTTRSGRSVKKPVKYEPDEVPLDDFREDEYDSDDDSDNVSEVSISDDDAYDSDDSFIDDEDEQCDYSSDGELPFESGDEVDGSEPESDFSCDDE